MHEDIVNFASGLEVCDYYILSRAEPKNGANGRVYLNAELKDATGTISCKQWDYSGDIHEHVGSVIKIKGRVDEYRNAKQLIIDQSRPLMKADTPDLSALLPVASIDAELAMSDIFKSIEAFSDEDYKRVCLAIYSEKKEDIMTSPAAKSVHHANIHGLLEHTCTMLRAAELICGLYPFLNKSLLLSGVLLHDIGKLKEFNLSPAGLVTEYSPHGHLIGHLVMGAMEVKRVCEELDIPEEKSMLLQHLMLSHHAEPEYGAAVVPRIPEAFMLHHLDAMDAELYQCREAIEAVRPGALTKNVYGLETALYRAAE